MKGWLTEGLKLQNILNNQLYGMCIQNQKTCSQLMNTLSYRTYNGGDVAGPNTAFTQIQGPNHSNQGANTAFSVASPTSDGNQQLTSIFNDGRVTNPEPQQDFIAITTNLENTDGTSLTQNMESRSKIENQLISSKLSPHATTNFVSQFAKNP